MARTRRYDVVLFGATGFTGALTARYLAEHAPAHCRWALAGRSPAKLDSVRADLGPALADLPLLIADVTDPASVQRIAESARVVVSTVGPYLQYGEPLVAACAEAGTDYLDLTGESEFVDLMYARHHRRAVASGARLVHCCGFDSIPYDLGVLFTVQQLPVGVPIRIDGVVRADAHPSSGTARTAITAFSRVRQAYSAASQRHRVEAPPVGARRARAVNGAPHRGDGMWLLPLPTVDPQVVARSAQTLDRYGPDFTYRHFAGIRGHAVAVGSVLGMAGVFTAAQLPPLRAALLRRFEPGGGPSAEQRAASWFRVRFTGIGGGKRVVTEVSGGDPGYGETSKMLAESALCMAFDELPATSGQVTTAVAMGDALLRRLQAAGIQFRVLESA
jgi:short subunit dehydrogenase-like uncharacterized protein